MDIEFQDAPDGYIPEYDQHSWKPKPYLKFWPRDWLSDPQVRKLPLDTRGFYFELLLLENIDGRLPRDVKEIGRMSGEDPRKVRRHLRLISTHFFSVSPLYIVNRRAENDRKTLRVYKEKLSKNSSLPSSSSLSRRKPPPASSSPKDAPAGGGGLGGGGGFSLPLDEKTEKARKGPSKLTSPGIGLSTQGSPKESQEHPKESTERDVRVSALPQIPEPSLGPPVDPGEWERFGKQAFLAGKAQSPGAFVSAVRKRLRLEGRNDSPDAAEASWWNAHGTEPLDPKAKPEPEPAHHSDHTQSRYLAELAEDDRKLKAQGGVVSFADAKKAMENSIASPK